MIENTFNILKTKRFLFFIFTVIFLFKGFSQGGFNLKKGFKNDKIHFKIVNNLIVLPVEVNGVELSFLLDSGVSKPIIFSFSDVKDSLLIKNTEKFYLRGLGDGDYIEAYKAKNNVVKIGNAINVNQDLYVIVEQTLNFAPRLGVPVNGIIGADLFKDFIVEINYAKSYLRLIEHKHFKRKKYKRFTELTLGFKGVKPYLSGGVVIGENEIPVKLLIDTGGSDALWLFEEKEKGIIPKQRFFRDYLGKGLSGNLYGKRSRIKQFNIADYSLDQVNVSFPDSASISAAKKDKDRNGSVSGNILKRFNLVFNYRDSTLLLKKNRNFKERFHYNNSGIILEHSGVRVIKEVSKGIIIKPFANNNTPFDKPLEQKAGYTYALVPSFIIVEILNDSPAYLAGLQLGDIILRINGTEAHTLKLQEIMQMFYDEDGKKIKLLVDRNGSELQFEFLLQDKLKKPR